MISENRISQFVITRLALLACVLVLSVPLIASEKCTLRVGAFMSEGDLISTSTKPTDHKLLRRFTAKISNKVTKLSYIGNEREDGLYYFLNIPEGTYRITISKPGFKTAFHREGVDCEDDPLSVNTSYFAVTLGSPQKITNYDFSAPLRIVDPSSGYPSEEDESEKIINDDAVNLPNPIYPKAAKAVKASGVVKVEIMVGTDGNVEEAKAISGHPLLLSTSERAAMLAKFPPACEDIASSYFHGVVTYTFSNTGEVVTSKNPGQVKKISAPCPPAQQEVSGEQQKAEENINVKNQPKPTCEKIVTPSSPRFVAGGVINSRVIYSPEIKYPPAAERVKVEGSVGVQVMVSIDGMVEKASAVSGPLLLRKEAEKVASMTTFEPYVLSCEKVKIAGVLVVEFTLLD